jgi:magnesium-transporting ATPase (P-type)
LKDAAARSIDNVLEELETSRGGLTSEEAARRLAEHGPNTLVEKKQVSFAYKFLAHFKDLFGVLLLFASLLAAIGAIWENDFGM